MIVSVQSVIFGHCTNRHQYPQWYASRIYHCLECGPLIGQLCELCTASLYAWRGVAESIMSWGMGLQEWSKAQTVTEIINTEELIFHR